MNRPPPIFPRDRWSTGAEPRARRARRAGGGFTLIELAVSTAVISILLVSIGSAILLASRAVPPPDDPTVRLVEAQRAADQIAAELHQAIHITEHEPRAVTFTVGDRSGNGSPELIRYAWSGQSGDPVTRSYNGGQAVPVLGAVYGLEFGYDIDEQVESYPGPWLASGDLFRVAAHPIAGEPRPRPIDAQSRAGQHIEPAWSTEVAAWRVTDVEVHAAAGPDGGDLVIELYRADSGRLPTGGALAEAVVAAADLPSEPEWVAVDLVSPPLEPDSGYAIVIRPAAAGHVADVTYDDDDGRGLLRSDDGGQTWTHTGGRALKHRVRGVGLELGPDQTVRRRHVIGTRLILTATADGAARAEAAARLPNAPELLSTFWLAEFYHDPTATDHNADGEGDWAMSGNNSFDTATLAGGIWRATQQLNTHPLSNFAELATVDLRFRDTEPNGEGGAGAWLRLDREGNTYAIFEPVITMQSDQTQTLTVWTHLSETTQHALATVEGLGPEFADVRLLVDPAQQTVNVRIDGQEHGTHTYQRWTKDNRVSRRVSYIHPLGGGAQFEQVRIRLGGND